MTENKVSKLDKQIDLTGLVAKHLIGKFKYEEQELIKENMENKNHISRGRKRVCVCVCVRQRERERKRAWSPSTYQEICMKNYEEQELIIEKLKKKILNERKTLKKREIDIERDYIYSLYSRKNRK